jgi:N-acetylneuraminic acid mutarotase
MNYRNLLLLIFSALVLNVTYASNQWTQRTDFGGQGRHRGIGISIANKGYIGLGHYNGTGVETYLSDWWEYDPASASWSQKMDYPGNNGNGELGAHGISLETIGYVGLGELDDYSLFKYDPSTNTWTEVTGPPSSGGSFQDSGDFTIGHKSYFMRIVSDQLWEYDSDLDQWT